MRKRWIDFYWRRKTARPVLVGAILVRSRITRRDKVRGFDWATEVRGERAVPDTDAQIFVEAVLRAGCVLVAKSID